MCWQFTAHMGVEMVMKACAQSKLRSTHGRPQAGNPPHVVSSWGNITIKCEGAK